MTFNLLEYADSVTDSIDSFLEPLHKNPTLYAFITLFLMLYGSLVKIKLPSILRQFMDNAIFRVMVLTLILVRKDFDLHLSLMIAIVYIYTLQLNNIEKTKEKFRSTINFYYKN